MNTMYFDTRTLQRDFHKANGGQLKDFGTDAPKGKRWAVLMDEIESTVNTASTNNESIVNALQRSILKDDAKQVFNRRGTVIEEETLTTPNNKPVRVLWRRNIDNMRLHVKVNQPS